MPPITRPPFQHILPTRPKFSTGWRTWDPSLLVHKCLQGAEFSALPPTIDSGVLCRAITYLQLERHDKLLLYKWLDVNRTAKTLKRVERMRAFLQAHPQVTRLDEALRRAREGVAAGKCRAKISSLTPWST